jgi:hypothetical protein
LVAKGGHRLALIGHLGFQSPGLLSLLLAVRCECLQPTDGTRRLSPPMSCLLFAGEQLLTRFAQSGHGRRELF